MHGLWQACHHNDLTLSKHLTMTVYIICNRISGNFLFKLLFPLNPKIDGNNPNPVGIQKYIKWAMNPFFLTR